MFGGYRGILVAFGENSSFLVLVQALTGGTLYDIYNLRVKSQEATRALIERTDGLPNGKANTPVSVGVCNHSRKLFSIIKINLR